MVNKKVHFSIAILYGSYLGLPICSIFSAVLLFTGYEKKPYIDNMSLLFQTFIAIAAGLTGLMGQILLTVAFFYDDVNKIMLIRSTELIFTYIFQYFFLKIHSNMFSITGAFLILLSVLMVIVLKIMDQKFIVKHKAYFDAKMVEKKKTYDHVKQDFVKPNLFKKILFYKF